MTDVLARQERLERTFRGAFHVRDVAEALASFDASTPAATVLERAERRGFAVVGVREHGLVTGYANADDLKEARVCGDAIRPFEDDEVVAGGTPLDEGLRHLAGRDRVFVTAFGQVAGIVTWTDVQKPPARMWLFGLVTLLENAFTGLIEVWHPDDSWRELISAGRLRKAKELLRERRRHGADVDLRLLDCLQLPDKGLILLRREETRRLFDMPSKEAGERALKKLAQLRNGLAHSQDIVTKDWDMILRLAGRLEDIVLLGSTFARPRRARPRKKAGSS
jgi:hypothetical protein